MLFRFFSRVVFVVSVIFCLFIFVSCAISFIIRSSDLFVVSNRWLNWLVRVVVFVFSIFNFVLLVCVSLVSVRIKR